MKKPVSDQTAYGTALLAAGLVAPSLRSPGPTESLRQPESART